MLTGLFSGLGSLAIARLRGEGAPGLSDIALALLLGFVAYELSIFLYVRAQRTLGAAKTSAYYAVNPFVGALLSLILLREALSGTYLVALAVMLAGTALVVADTLIRSHSHAHQHVLVHTHGGHTHSHVVAHSHAHNHIATDERHAHRHPRSELEREATGRV